jgi:hypothetical protein
MKANQLSLKTFIFLLFLAPSFKSQNNVMLQLSDGTPFKVLLNDKPYNSSPQSQVALTDIKQDTLLIKVELEKGERFGLTLYLLDKGKKTSAKEFTFVLYREKIRLRPVFMGMRDADTLKK